MIAYNHQTLDQVLMRSEVERAYKKRLITAGERNAVNAAYPDDFYSPHIFIRAGLFIVTAVAILAAVGLMLLMDIVRSANSVANFCIFLTIALYAACEFFIRGTKHHKSGVDTALMWGAGLAFVTFFFAQEIANSESQISAVIMIGAAYLALRFADLPMSVIAYAALIATVYFSLDTSAVLSAFAPFIIAIVSLGAYLLFHRLSRPWRFRHYRNCLLLLQLCALLSLYGSLNYFIVTELARDDYYNAAAYEVATGGSQSAYVPPLAWLFWITTIAIPAIYLLLGLRNKNRVMLGAGMLLVAAAVYTVRYYHEIMPIETVMLLSGICLVVIALGAIRYLKTPRHGFTKEEDDASEQMEKLHLESLVIAQTMSTTTTPEKPWNFGGGSGVGGGATGDF
ncbi:hypothetical protein MKQ68_07960 [Chitinophaga horti]|uniref:DUF2157 domain-containing protein n=1 Tax=Chitinophaga horti TaxID=2920382 RepID=A0ABY6J9L0_9BACT|nr:hypothetical protein [Chitinophaga horti]UYQ95027.1 hypothetical protein MKQ68_07960 [Chitinophaga horti]